MGLLLVFDAVFPILVFDWKKKCKSYTIHENKLEIDLVIFDKRSCLIHFLHFQSKKKKGGCKSFLLLNLDFTHVISHFLTLGWQTHLQIFMRKHEKKVEENFKKKIWETIMKSMFQSLMHVDPKAEYIFK